MNIALAIIVDPPRDRTLVAQRPPGSHLEQFWEFPGGKIESNETAVDCAIREAKEETDLDVSVLEVWVPITFEYPDKVVTLHPFLCEPRSLERWSARWRWVFISDLHAYPFPAANGQLLDRLKRLKRGA